MMAPASPYQCGAETPAQRKDAVLVDPDQRHGAGVLTRRFERAAEIGSVDEEIQRAERRDRDRAPTSCGSGRKMPPIEMVLPPSQEWGTLR